MRHLKKIHQVQLHMFIWWFTYKVYRLLRPKDGTLTPNTMKIWSQFAYVNNPWAAESFWKDIPWTWEKEKDG